MLGFLIMTGLILAMSYRAYTAALTYGIPGIRNFSRADYKGANQNWSFTESENGLLYFANNDGLAEFNGKTWTIYRSVKAVHRVVCADGKRVYIGAFNDFGYYEENERGILKYHSLLSLLPEKERDFNEIWKIHKTKYGIVFQSFKAIFIFQNNSITRLTPPSGFHFSFYVNERLWVYDEKSGLMQLDRGKLLPIPGGRFFSGRRIWSILSLNPTEVLIGTARDGLFRYDGKEFRPWNPAVNDKLKKHQLYSARKLKNNSFAFGTIQNGLILTDSEGNLMLEINKERGLPNNTVLDIGQDSRGNIWLCLDNGISMIDYESPISFFQNYFDIGTLYSSARLGGIIYLGTNQGLFYTRQEDFVNPSKSKSSFILIPGTEGQVWNLSVIDNTLFCGHNNGIYEVRGITARRISFDQGAWNFLRINQSPMVLVGTYGGLTVLEKRGESWEFRNNIRGFSESSRFVQMDNSGNIWVSHTYKGVYRLSPDPDWRQVLSVRFFNSGNGLPSDQANSLFNIRSEPVLATTKGIFSFNSKTGNFEKSTRYSPYFDAELPVTYLYEDSRQNIWFCADKRIGVLRRQEDGSFKKITVPFQVLNDQIIPSFEHIRELDQNNVLIGIEGGFANYLANNVRDYSKPCSIFISEFRSSDTTEGIFRYDGTKNSQTLIPAFKYRNNTISVTFAANIYESESVDFQYKLAGFDEDWSEWSTETTKEYTNLPDGKYTFLIRARNNSLSTPAELSYHFIILPPWYRSVYALILYGLMLIILIWLGKKYFDQSMEKSRKTEFLKQEELHRLREQRLKEDSLIAEKEVERLRNEALNLEMIHKEKELANSSMLLIKKNEMLNLLYEELQSISSSPGTDTAKSKINSLIRKISKEIDNDNQKKVFNLHLEQVYEVMFKKLKEQYPEITPHELNLCAYLRMNMSSKEIATLMNISPRGVEIGRYRLRKKLKLDREANLTDFIMNL